MPITTNGTLEARLQKLAEFEPAARPVLSLYLNAQPDQRGKDHFAPWLKKELAARGRTFQRKSPELESFEADGERIRKWFEQELDPASNGVALFACSAAKGFFEAIQVEAPIDHNELHVQDHLHLYPLARLIDQYPRYAVVLADTNFARIAVFELNRLQLAKEVQNLKTRRTMVGGWSQARFQRHVDEFRKQHAKEVVEVLERVVREEGVKRLVLAGDQEVVIPLLREEMPKHLSEMIIDVLRLDPAVEENILLEKSMDALRADNARRDADTVDHLMGEYRSGGLAVVGLPDTLKALERGQVDELVLAAAPSAGEAVDALVTKARQTSAKVNFIENSALLSHVGGCGGLLRYRI